MRQGDILASLLFILVTQLEDVLISDGFKNHSATLPDVNISARLEHVTMNHKLKQLYLMSLLVLLILN